MQLELVHETIEDALGFVIQALGGAKKVGAALRPEIPADHAAQWVRDCLNAGRRERFSPSHVMWLLRAARAAGVHSAMHFIAGEAGDEVARLQREYIDATKALVRMAERIERLRSVARCLTRPVPIV